MLKWCCSNGNNRVIDEYTIEEYSQVCSITSNSSVISDISTNSFSADPMSQKMGQLYFHVWLGALKFLKSNLLSGNTIIWLEVGYFIYCKVEMKFKYAPIPELIRNDQFHLLRDNYNLELKDFKPIGSKVFLNYVSIAKLAHTELDTVNIILKDLLQHIVFTLLTNSGCWQITENHLNSI